MRREAEPEFHHRIAHMEAVVDQLDGDPRILHSRWNGTGPSVMQSIHGVEHMRHDACTGGEALTRSLIIGVAMADCRNHAGIGESTDRADAVGQLRSDGDLPQAAIRGPQYVIHQAIDGIAQALRIMGTLARRRKERSFEMHAKNVGAHVRLPADCA